MRDGFDFLCIITCLRKALGTKPKHIKSELGHRHNQFIYKVIMNVYDTFQSGRLPKICALMEFQIKEPCVAKCPFEYIV